MSLPTRSAHTFSAAVMSAQPAPPVVVVASGGASTSIPSAPDSVTGWIAAPGSRARATSVMARINFLRRRAVGVSRRRIRSNWPGSEKRASARFRPAEANTVTASGRRSISWSRLPYSSGEMTPRRSLISAYRLICASTTSFRPRRLGRLTRNDSSSMTSSGVSVARSEFNNAMAIAGLTLSVPLVGFISERQASDPQRGRQQGSRS